MGLSGFSLGKLLGGWLLLFDELLLYWGLKMFLLKRPVRNGLFFFYYT
jgi:hypothetical protein